MPNIIYGVWWVGPKKCASGGGGAPFFLGPPTRHHILYWVYYWVYYWTHHWYIIGPIICILSMVYYWTHYCTPWYRTLYRCLGYTESQSFQNGYVSHPSVRRDMFAIVLSSQSSDNRASPYQKTGSEYADNFLREAISCEIMNMCASLAATSSNSLLLHMQGVTCRTCERAVLRPWRCVKEQVAELVDATLLWVLSWCLRMDQTNEVTSCSHVVRSHSQLTAYMPHSISHEISLFFQIGMTRQCKRSAIAISSQNPDVMRIVFVHLLSRLRMTWCAPCRRSRE